MGSGGSRAPQASQAVNSADLQSSTINPGTGQTFGIGNKYAVLIGCNYTGTNFALNGCINDVGFIKDVLQPLGFSITTMIDTSTGSNYPTKNNIITNLTNSINNLNDNDILVIYYSGHGSQVQDFNNDEVSGLDSVIVPIDVRSNGYIIDDQLRNIFKSVKSTTRVLAFFDSCNSGSVCDLRYCYFDTSYREYPSAQNSSLISRANLITNTKYDDLQGQVVSISGCRDTELSYETISYQNKPGGALTYCVVKYLKENPNITFTDFLQNIRSLLSQRGFAQTPSLMSGKLLDVNTKLSSFLGL
jgi:hypothetical protein